MRRGRLGRPSRKCHCEDVAPAHKRHPARWLAAEAGCARELETQTVNASVTPRISPAARGSPAGRPGTGTMAHSWSVLPCAHVAAPTAAACEVHPAQAGGRARCPSLPGPTAGTVDNGGNTEPSEIENRKWVNSVPLLGNDETRCVSALRCNHAKLGLLRFSRHVIFLHDK